MVTICLQQAQGTLIRSKELQATVEEHPSVARTVADNQNTAHAPPPSQPVPRGANSQLLQHQRGKLTHAYNPRT